MDQHGQPSLSNDMDGDNNQWRQMFATLTAKISQEADEDVRKILQDSAYSAQKRNVGSVLAASTSKPKLVSEIPPKQNNNDTIGGRSHEELSSDVEALQTKVDFLTQKLERERELNTSLKSELVQLKDKLQDEVNKQESLTMTQNSRFEQTISAILEMLKAIHSCGSEASMEKVMQTAIGGQLVKLFDTSSRRIRDCPQSVQDAANTKQETQSEETLCIPIVEGSEGSVRNVLQVGSIAESYGIMIARIACESLRIRLSLAIAKDKETSITERCETLVSMVSIIGNVESERARHPSMITWAQEQLSATLKCQTCRIWLIDETTNELLSYTGDPAVEHREQAGTGIIGYVQNTKQYLINNGLLSLHPRFNAKVDAPKGIDIQRCSSLLCVPAAENSDGTVHAIIQFLNKRDSQKFTNSDLETAQIFCRRLCSAIRREKRASARSDQREKDLSNATIQCEQWKARMTACESMSNLFGTEGLDLYPGNFSSKVTSALMEALNADVVTIAAVMPRHLLPFRFERVDKISSSAAFRKLAKQAIDTRSITSRANVNVAKVSQPLVLICGPLLDSLGRVIATVLAGVKSSKYGPHSSVIISIFSAMCGAFLDRKHSQLNAAFTNRMPLKDEEESSRSLRANKENAPTHQLVRHQPSSLRIDSLPRAPSFTELDEHLSSEDEANPPPFSRTSSVGTAETDALGLQEQREFAADGGDGALALTSTGSGSVSEWRDWMTNELPSDTEPEDKPKHISTTDEARIKSFALLHAGSVSNVYDVPGPSSRNRSGSIRRNLNRDTSRSRLVQVAPPKLKETKSSSKLTNPAPYRRLSRMQSESRDLDEVNEIRAALYIESDDIFDTVEFTGGEVEYVHPDGDETSDQVFGLTMQVPRPKHDRVISFDQGPSFYLDILSHDDEDTSMKKQPDRKFSLPVEDVANDKSTTFDLVKSHSIELETKNIDNSRFIISSTSSTSSHRSSRGGGFRRPNSTRRKKFQNEAGNEKSAKKKSTSVDDHNLTAGNLQMISLENDNDELLRVMQALGTTTELPLTESEPEAILTIAEGALLALSVVLTQSDQFQIRIGSRWYKWLPETETISGALSSSFYTIPAGLREPLDMPNSPSWKGELCAYIAKGHFNRIEMAGMRAVSARLNAVLAYQSHIASLSLLLSSENKESARLQSQLQIATSLLECARTCTLSKGVHVVFNNDSCQLAKFLNAESAQIWLFDQTCAQLWTAVDTGSNNTVKTLRCPIDCVSLLTQVAVSRISAVYHENDECSAYNEEIDGISVGLKSSLKPRSLLISAIGNDVEGVLGVIRVCNKSDADSGTRSKFSNADQRFLESACVIFLDTVRSHRNNMKLQDRLEPALKLAQTERHGRQRMQVLLSAQVSRLSKFNKRAVHLGEAASTNTKFINSLTQICNGKKDGIRTRLEEACLTMWKSICGIQFCNILAASEMIKSWTDLKSVHSVIDLSNCAISELVEHVCANNEIADSEVSLKDVSELWNGTETGSHDKRRCFCLPICDQSRSVVAVCVLVGSELDSQFNHELATLFCSIVGLWLQLFINLQSLQSETGLIRSDLIACSANQQRLESAKTALQKVLDLIADLTNCPSSSALSTEFLKGVDHLSGCHSVWCPPGLKPFQFSTTTTDKPFRIDVSSDSLEVLKQLYPTGNLWDQTFIRTCVVKDRCLISMNTKPFLDSDIELFDYIGRVGLTLVGFIEEHLDSTKLVKDLQTFAEGAKMELHLMKSSSMYAFWCREAADRLWDSGLQDKDTVVKELANRVGCKQASFVIVQPAKCLPELAHEIMLTDTNSDLLSNPICINDAAEAKSVAVDWAEPALNLISAPLKHRTGFVILGTKREGNFTTEDQQFLDMFISFVSPIVELLNDSVSRDIAVNDLQRQCQDMSLEINSCQSERDVLKCAVEASVNDWGSMESLSSIALAHMEPTLRNMFRKLEIQADSIQIFSPWSRITSLEELTFDLPSSAITQAKATISMGKPCSMFFNDDCIDPPTKRHKYPARAGGGCSVMWIPVIPWVQRTTDAPVASFIMQIVRRYTECKDFSASELLAASLFARSLNSAFAVVNLQSEILQLQQKNYSAVDERERVGNQLKEIWNLLGMIIGSPDALIASPPSALLTLQQCLAAILSCELCTIFINTVEASKTLIKYTRDGIEFVKINVLNEPCIISWVCSTGTPYSVVDVETDPRYNDRFDNNDGTVKKPSSAMFIPLYRSKMVVGVIQATRYGQRSPFLNGDIEICALLGGLMMLIQPSIELASVADSTNDLQISQDVSAIPELRLLLSTGDWRIDRADAYICTAQDIFNALHNRIRAEGCGMFVLDDVNMRFRLVYTDLDLAENRVIDEIHFGTRQGLLGAAVSSASIQKVSNTVGDPRFQAFPDQWMRSSLNSTIIVPLIDASSSVVCGLIQLVNVTLAANTDLLESDLQYARCLSALASVVVQVRRQTLRLETESNQTVERLSSTRIALQTNVDEIRELQALTQCSAHIVDFCGAIIGVSTLAPLFQAVQYFVCKAFLASRAHLFLLDSDQKDMFCNISDDVGGAAHCLRLPLDASVVGVVQRTANPTIICHPWTENPALSPSNPEAKNLRVALENLPWYTATTCKAILAAPVRDHNQQIIGVIEVCRFDLKNGRNWCNDDVVRLELICNRVASALQNCRQFHRLKSKFDALMARLRMLEQRRREQDENDELDDGYGSKPLRSKQAARQEMEHMVQLQSQLQAALTDRDQLKFETSKLYSALEERETQVISARQRIEALEKNVRYAQMQFRTMIVESVDDDEIGETHAREMNVIKRELEQARGDNIELVSAMQSLISSYAADGSNKVNAAIQQAKLALNKDNPKIAPSRQIFSYLDK